MSALASRAAAMAAADCRSRRMLPWGALSPLALRLRGRPGPLLCSRSLSSESPAPAAPGSPSPGAQSPGAAVSTRSHCMITPVWQRANPCCAQGAVPQEPLSLRRADSNPRAVTSPAPWVSLPLPAACATPYGACTQPLRGAIWINTLLDPGCRWGSASHEAWLVPALHRKIRHRHLVQGLVDSHCGKEGEAPHLRGMLKADICWWTSDARCRVKHRCCSCSESCIGSRPWLLLPWQVRATACLTAACSPSYPPGPAGRVVPAGTRGTAGAASMPVLPGNLHRVALFLVDKPWGDSRASLASEVQAADTGDTQLGPEKNP